MSTYIYKIVVEPDENKWYAYCPALKQYGAVTWGNSKEEALKHIYEVVEMITEEFIEEGKTIPKIGEEVEISLEPKVAVNL